MPTISFTGNKGGKIASMTDVSLVVPSAKTARIQESHICLAHIICELVEKEF
jgi:D-sedoheptulose 7-phosphate isomerase